VDAVIASLESMAYRLAQSIQQANLWLIRQHDAGGIGDDRLGMDPIRTVVDVSTDLLLAAGMADNLARKLSAVHQQTAHLTSTIAD
jgi:hypothetical protein